MNIPCIANAFLIKIAARLVCFILVMATGLFNGEVFAASFNVAKDVPPLSPIVSAKNSSGAETYDGSARLQVMQSADRQTVNPNESISYRTRVVNVGGVNFSGQIVEKLAGVDFTFSVDNIDSTLGKVSYESVPEQLVWNGSLPIGASVTITYDVLVGYGAKNGDYLTSSIVTPSNAEVVECLGCDLRVEVAAPQLRVFLTADRQAAAPGETINYVAQIENVGRQDYTQDVYSRLDNTVSDPSCRDDCAREVPGHYSADVSASLAGDMYYGGDYFWWWGRIPVGQTLVLNYSAQVNDHVFEGDKLVASVSATCCVDLTAISNLVAVDIVVPPRNQLRFDIRADRQEAKAGDKVSYEVQIHNVGAEGYYGVVDIDLKDTLDKAQYNYDASSSGGGSLDFYEFTGLKWEGPVAGGDTVTLKYSVTVASSTPAGSRLLNTIIAPKEVEIVGVLPVNVVNILASPIVEPPEVQPGQCKTTVRLVIEWPFKLVWEKITICNGQIVSSSRI